LSAFTERFKNDNIVEKIKDRLREDILEAYPQVKVKEDDDLMEVLLKVNAATAETFILIIDEWDAICREFPPSSPAMDDYVGWMRRMFKDVNASRVFAGVYMTGICFIFRRCHCKYESFPVRKYGHAFCKKGIVFFSDMWMKRMFFFVSFDYILRRHR
jgi:hypothetical protein